MSYRIPQQPTSLEELARRQQNVVTASQLRARGVPARLVSEHCRQGGPWQRLLPRVYLLQEGPPTPEQRMWAALLYAAQNGRAEGGRERAVITGAAALALYGFVSMPRLPAVLGVEVLVPRQRRLRDAGQVRIRRTERELVAREVHGLACAPVARAVADAVREWAEQGAFEPGGPGAQGEHGAYEACRVGPGLLRAVLREALERVGGCGVSELLAELTDAGLLAEPPVRAAVDELLAAQRESALSSLLELAVEQGLPLPLPGPELRMRGGTYIAVPDLFWPEAAVAVEVDSEVRCVSEGEAAWVRAGQHRMEYLGVRVVYVGSARLAAERDAVGDELAEAYRLGGEDVVALTVTER
ncbi:hypothetical protein [Kitasatospora sp. NPDC004531]